jgi:hypothetical protein
MPLRSESRSLAMSLVSWRTACRILSSTSLAANPVSRKWNFGERCNVSGKKPARKFSFGNYAGVCVVGR